jgi:hypothetical protein
MAEILLPGGNHSVARIRKPRNELSTTPLLVRGPCVLSINKDVGVKKTLPDVQLFPRPPVSFRVTGVCVHQPEHFVRQCLTVSQHGSDQELTNQRVQGRLMPARIAASASSVSSSIASVIFFMSTAYVRT